MASSPERSLLALIVLAGCGAAPPPAPVDHCAPAIAEAAGQWTALAEAFASRRPADLDAIRARLAAALENESQYSLPDTEAESLANAFMDAIDQRDHELAPALRDRAENAAERLLTDRRGEAGATAAREGLHLVDELAHAIRPELARVEDARAIATAYRDDARRADDLANAWSPIDGDAHALTASRDARAACHWER